MSGTRFRTCPLSRGWRRGGGDDRGKEELEGPLPVFALERGDDLGQLTSRRELRD
jgi:hypothetical protein